MSFPAGLCYRRMQAADLLSLQKQMPDLLPGNWSLEALQELLLSSHICYLLSLGESVGSLVLGFVEFTIVADECELLSIAVASQNRGMGLGRLLLEKVLQEARKKGCKNCFLEVRRSNDAAIGLYVSTGFAMTGKRRAYYPPLPGASQAEDALLYSLNL